MPALPAATQTLQSRFTPAALSSPGTDPRLLLPTGTATYFCPTGNLQRNEPSRRQEPPGELLAAAWRLFGGAAAPLTTLEGSLQRETASPAAFPHENDGVLQSGRSRLHKSRAERVSEEGFSGKSAG